MKTVLRQVHGRLMVAGYRKGIIGHFEGIPLVSFHDEHDDFLNVVTAALALIREYDPRRFRRVVSQTHWIVDLSLYRGRYSAQFNLSIKAITIDFAYDQGMGDELFHAAYFAGCMERSMTGESPIRRRIVPRLNGSVGQSRIASSGRCIARGPNWAKDCNVRSIRMNGRLLGSLRL